MTVTLHSTTKVVTLNGVPARVWEGHTANGIPVHAYITRIAVANDAQQMEFEAELVEQRTPSPVVDAIPGRMIL